MLFDFSWSSPTATVEIATVIWCRSEGCELSGLYFEAAGCSIVCYCLSNYLLRWHRVAVNITWGQDGLTLMVKCKALERAPTPPLWQTCFTCKVLCPWALFRETTVIVSTNIFQALPLFVVWPPAASVGTMLRTKVLVKSPQLCKWTRAFRS